MAIISIDFLECREGLWSRHLGIWRLGFEACNRAATMEFCSDHNLEYAIIRVL